MRLIYERGEERIAFPLDEGETYIGRKDDCEIHLPDGSLSKRHARLVRRGRELTVFDAGSRNGTLVNGDLITEGQSRRLKNGDVIQCGKLSFTVEGIPSNGAGSAEEFEVLEESENAVGGGRRGSRASLLVARAVGSAEVRPSVLDVMPEVEDPSQAPTARFSLIEAKEPRSWDLVRETATIGSKPENRIVIEGEGVSRYHAEVVWEEGKWVLKDLGSRNGVFVAGNRVDIHELCDGDEVQIGTVRLRFELVKASPTAPLLELIRKVQDDPARAFKEEPRLRMALAAAITALVLVIMALGSGGGGQQDPGSMGLTWLEDATQKLQRREYKSASQDVKRAMNQGWVPLELGPLARSVDAVASFWGGIDPRSASWHMDFNWTKGEKLLADMQATKGIPAYVAAWGKTEQDWVARHKAAYEQLGQAQGTAASAAEMARQGQVVQAVQTWRDALRTYESIDPSTPFIGNGKELATQLRRTIHDTLTGELRRRMAASIPDWDECQQLATTAIEFTSSSEQRADLRRVEEECTINRRDEEAYTRAVDIVNARDLANYPTAIRLLNQVDKRSRIYPDAQAYLQWIEADLKVRDAKKAYDAGEDEKAFRLLREALQYEVLGPEAKLSVQQRQQNWRLVVGGFKRGMVAYRQGKSAEAKAQLDKVLQLETNRDNWWHKQARSQLRHIAEREAYGLERRLRDGLTALDKGYYEEAIQWFNEVKEDPNCRSTDLEKIREKVVDTKRKRRMISEAKNLIMLGRDEEYLPLYYKLQLLDAWLPPDDRDLPEARKMYNQVRSRLQTLLKQARSVQTDKNRRRGN